MMRVEVKQFSVRASDPDRPSMLFPIRWRIELLGYMLVTIWFAWRYRRNEIILIDEEKKS